MNSPAKFAQQALAAYHARHKAADDVQYNAAAFYHNGKAYVVTVRDYVVLITSRLSEVREFSAMHNSRIS